MIPFFLLAKEGLRAIWKSNILDIFFNLFIFNYLKERRPPR
jgi:hypothetical protein